ncbi:MAG: hypothetical protein M3275_16665, partial [Thermoproteota archaeon]|nr:hypothetical protein [Thermoproteota archaeon]
SSKWLMSPASPDLYKMAQIHDCRFKDEVGLHFQSNQATASMNSTLIYRGSKKDTHMEVHVLCYRMYQMLSSLLARFSDSICITLLAAYIGQS